MENLIAAILVGATGIAIMLGAVVWILIEIRDELRKR